MRVSVRLFAVARQKAGSDEISLELSPGATVADLRRSLAAIVPTLAPLLPTFMIAIDAVYARDIDVIPPHAELAVIPPVSGGALNDGSDE